MRDFRLYAMRDITPEAEQGFRPSGRAALESLKANTFAHQLGSRLATSCAPSAPSLSNERSRLVWFSLAQRSNRAVASPSIVLGRLPYGRFVGYAYGYQGIQQANKRAGDSAYVRRARLWSDECSVESRVARSNSSSVRHRQHRSGTSPSHS
jgi:hypothetical protein